MTRSLALFLTTFLITVINKNPSCGNERVVGKKIHPKGVCPANSQFPRVNEQLTKTGCGKLLFGGSKIHPERQANIRAGSVFIFEVAIKRLSRVIAATVTTAVKARKDNQQKQKQLVFVRGFHNKIN